METKCFVYRGPPWCLTRKPGWKWRKSIPWHIAAVPEVLGRRESVPPGTVWGFNDGTWQFAVCFVGRIIICCKFFFFYNFQKIFVRDK